MKKIVTYMMTLGMMFTAVPANAVFAAETPAIVSSAAETVEAVSIKELAGKWNYDVADKNADSVDEKPVCNGVVVIKEDGTYVYTDANGKITEGTVKTGIEEIGGTKHKTVSFYEGSEFKFGGYYEENTHNRISLGNGGMSRLVRVNTIKTTIAGDANCDNNVDLSDSVLIMQSISNPSKYGVNGSDSHRITQQGLVNADCFNMGDGVTNADALAVQKYKLSLISSL